MQNRALIPCVMIAFIAVVMPANAQLHCTSSSDNVSCTNTGSIGDLSNNEALLGGPGSTNFTNSGMIGNSSFNQAFTNGAGSATFTNSGTIGGNSITQANVQGDGTATETNSGTIGDHSSNQAFLNGNGTATFTNTGQIGSGSTNQANGQRDGAAIFSNGGTIGASSLNQAFLNGNGTASFVNSGTIGGSSTNAVNVQGNGSAKFTNNGTIGINSFNEAFVGGNGSVTFANSGQIAAGSSNGAEVLGTGAATFINAGAIIGSVQAIAPAGTATLTNTAGSLIVGSITLAGSTKALEFVGGNYVYTLQSMTGVQVNAHGAPFAVSGNTVSVLDPTGFALADRSVMNFTGGISSVLQDRFESMGVGGAAARSPLPMGFAPETAGLDRIGAALDAFVGLPSVSMSYASDDSKARNAMAMYTKAPVALAPVNDITVWTSGFGGERHQSAFDSVQGARDDAYGGVIGLDRQFTPDLRLGLFAGGGFSRLRTDFNVQNVDSDYTFGGGYGRYDRHDYYLDFALFAGAISSSESRQVANNLIGFETAAASYNGWFVSPDVTAGYRISTDWGVVTPKARVRYVGGMLDGYTESGSAQGLTVGARNLSDVEERLGVELASTQPAGWAPGTLKVSAEFDAVGLQRLGDDTINAVLLAQNIAFTTPGKAQAYGGAANAMVEWRPIGSVSLYVSGEGMIMDDRSYSVVGKGGVRVAF